MDFDSSKIFLPNFLQSLFAKLFYRQCFYDTVAMYNIVPMPVAMNVFYNILGLFPTILNSIAWNINITEH